MREAFWSEKRGGGALPALNWQEERHSEVETDSLTRSLDDHFHHKFVLPTQVHEEIQGSNTTKIPPPVSVES